MKNLKILFCLFFLLSIGSTDVWGVVNEGEEYSWNSSTKTLTIHKAGDYADGIMDDISNVTTELAWYDLIRTGSPSGTKPVHLIIEDGITHLGAYIFYNCSTAMDVQLPATLHSIGRSAFWGCSAMTKIYYASSPSGWASIDFQENVTAHPFGAKADESYGNIYFHGNTESATTRLVLDPSITEISKFAFVKTSFTNGMSIPGTITKIGEQAFYYSKIASASESQIAINCKTAPTLGTNAFSNISGSTTIYIPSGNSGYTASGWSIFSTRTAKAVSGTVDGQSWSLDKNGVLTISGSGALTTSFLIADGASQYPYYYFRFLVDKVVITGGITGLSNILQRCSAVREIEIQQNNIPTASANTPAYYYNPENAVLRVRLASLASLNHTISPWSWTKRALFDTETAVIDQEEDNTALLTALNTKLTEPFNLQLNRSTLSTEYYNTFCSPVSMTEEEIVSMFGGWYDEDTKEGTELVEYTGTSTEEDETITLQFSGATSIVAGKPYLFRPANDVPNIRFINVEPSSLATSGRCVEDDNEKIDFYGILEPKEITSDEIENQSVIFLTGTIVDGKQQLTWANGGTLKGMRAYWKVKEDTPASVMAKRPVLQIGNGENTTTDLGQVPSDKIQCTKVLRDGQIYILRGEKAYNLQGIEIDRPNKL